MTRTHKLVNLTGIILPFAGLVIAVVVLWERMVGPTELAILAVGYMLTGAGITVGSTASSRTGHSRRIAACATRSPSSVGWPSRATCSPGSRTIGSTISSLTWKATPQPARRLRGRSRRRGARALARSYRLAVLGCRPRRAVALREGPAARPRPRVIAKLFLPLVLFSLAAPAVAGWLLIGGWYGFFAGLFGRRRPDLPAPARHLLDQLHLPHLGPPAFRLARRVAERLVAVLALVRRVVAQQPPRVPELGVPRPPRAEIDPGGWLIWLLERAGLAWNVVRIPPDKQARKLATH